MPGKSERKTDMSKRQENGRDGLSKQQPQNLTATSLAAAHTARDARADGGQEVAEPVFEGALPSNTAPYNSNTGQDWFKALNRPGN